MARVKSSAQGFADPSLTLTIIATVAFGVVTGYHVFLCVKRKTWHFWWMILAALMETTGYGLRAYYAKNPYPTESRKFLVSYLLITIAPFIMTISLMTTLSRLSWYTTPPFKRTFTHTWLPKGIPLKLFKVGYISSMIIAFIGAGGIVNSYSHPSSPTPSSTTALTASENMLRAAFVVQAASVGGLLVITLHYLLTSKSYTASALLSSALPPTHWRRLLAVIAQASALLLLRTVYHTFELSDSTPTIKDFIADHAEVFFWTCDAALMWALLLLLVYVHPGHCVPVEYTIFWFSERKVRRMEKKVLETQTWPVGGWSAGDVEQQYQSQQQQQQQQQKQPSETAQSLPWPQHAHLPGRN